MLASLLLGTTLCHGGVEAMKNQQTPRAGQAAIFSFGGEQNREFLLDGKPFQIRSGEIHPQRVPRQHWRQRIRAAKAMGLNTIAFYVFWNDVETSRGQWDFTGNRDIAAFIDLCAEEGMWVLFRPGPYVCGEWDLGGLPTYLIAADESKLRTTQNADYMKESERYLQKMAEIAIPRLAKNGGPILMVQLENEYGSYKTDHDELAYIEWIKTFWEDKGAGPFYLSEGSASHHLRFVPQGVAIGLDPAECENDMKTARRIAPHVPVFSSETYPGWLRHWGEGNWAATPETLDAMRWYMKSGTSFNIFVVHGGTSFGLTAGANCKGDTGLDFEPDITSYDYGSPIGEHGNYAPEFAQYREIIAAALPKGTTLPEPPATPPSMEIAPFTPKQVCPLSRLFTSAAQAQELTIPATLESLGQNQGIAVYSTTLPAGPAAKLECRAQDYAQVYLGDKLIGIINRMKNEVGIDLPERAKAEPLRILVDTFGHLNFNRYMETERKGILGAVKLSGQPVANWEIRLLPLDKAPAPKAQAAPAPYRGGFYAATIHLDKVEDTFLDMSHWVKGYVWVNGHHLGRYWNIGPQQRLYCPAEFLKAGDNTVQVLDTDAGTPRSIRGCTERNMDSDKQTQNLNNAW